MRVCADCKDSRSDFRPARCPSLMLKASHSKKHISNTGDHLQLKHHMIPSVAVAVASQLTHRIHHIIISDSLGFSSKQKSSALWHCAPYSGLSTAKSVAFNHSIQVAATNIEYASCWRHRKHHHLARERKGSSYSCLKESQTLLIVEWRECGMLCNSLQRSLQGLHSFCKTSRLQNFKLNFKT